MVNCLTQEHKTLVTAGHEPATFGFRVRAFIHCASRASEIRRYILMEFDGELHAVVGLRGSVF